LNWPFKGLWLDAEMNGAWWPEWGERPADTRGRYKTLRSIVRAAPKLIPVFGHRYIPDAPYEAGNPVFSVFYGDIIYYGANLEHYIAAESGNQGYDDEWPPIRRIDFWSRAVDINNEAFASRAPGEPAGVMRAKDLGLPPFGPKK
jgi:hypothetical protein